VCFSEEVIVELQLENWKSYENSVLSIDTLSVLIGTNASGKSNALDALVLLNRTASGVLLTSALQGDGVLPPLRGGVEWAARKPGETFAITAICRSDDETTDYEYRLECYVTEKRCEISAEKLTRKKYRLRKDGGRQTNPGVIQLFRTDACSVDSPTITARLYNGKQGTPRQLGRGHSVLFQLYGQKVGQDIFQGIQEVISPLREIFVLDPIPSHMRGYSPLADKLEGDARNIAGVIAVLTQNDRDSVEKVLTKYVSKLPERDIRRVWAETVGKFKTDAMLYCEEHWTEAGEAPIVDARGMSDGTLRFLAILTALLTRPKGSLLVVEEVDNGLHPSRSKLLLDMLFELGEMREVDVLVTTHNPALLDAMGPDMVPYITVAHRNSATGCSVLVPLEDISQLPKLLAQGPIGQISSKGLLERALRPVNLSFDFEKAG
jgi:predicted ATPase